MTRVIAATIMIASFSPSSGLADVLLDTFAPRLSFQIQGDERLDYPCSYLFDGDSNIENNARATINWATRCYGNVYEDVDVNGKPYAVLEYHYYYPANMYPGGVGWIMTHEHDWEWIYIVVGYDEGVVVPYCATYSGHSDHNRDIFNPVTLRWTPYPLRLFPGVSGGSVGRTLLEQLGAVPNVVLQDGRLTATAWRTGNEFSSQPDPTISEFWEGYTPETGHEEYEVAPCSNAAFFYFGDPNASEDSNECGKPKDPPWSRDGLGDRDPLPDDFALPDTWDDGRPVAGPWVRDKLLVERREDILVFRFALGRQDSSRGYYAEITKRDPVTFETLKSLWREWCEGSRTIAREVAVAAGELPRNADVCVSLDVVNDDGSRAVDVVRWSRDSGDRRLGTFEVFPYPATRSLKVLFHHRAPERLRLCGVDGRVVRIWQVPRELTLVLDVSTVPSGVYWLAPDTGSGSEVRRVCVLH